MSDWKIFQRDGSPQDDWTLPPPPPWRDFRTKKEHQAEVFQILDEEVDMVNAALYLRRPLLVTGKPGTGKSSLAYAVARQLCLGEVLSWSITTRTTLKDGLYAYDAIARLQDARQGNGNSDGNGDAATDIGRYITLGALGTAFLPSAKPRILLIDEIDKSDIDLPNDLLHIFEEGEFKIPELERLENQEEPVEVWTAYKDPEHPDYKASIRKGRVCCQEFPLTIMTSNGERDFPAPFLRRCIRLTMQQPNTERLRKIVEAHLTADEVKQAAAEIERLVKKFVKKRDERQEKGDLATDQLLSAVYMVTRGRSPEGDSWEKLVEQLFKHLSSAEDV